MSNEITNYKATDSDVLVKSRAIYNGKFVPTSKDLGLDFRSSLKQIIDSIDKALRESEKILPLKKVKNI
jgi:ABC-type phosphate/phosphonate transport system substrate-binding protein